jgi:nucleoside-diphosphate-sugar epimerase
MTRILITGASGFVGTHLICYFSGMPEVMLFGFGRKQVPGITMLSDCRAETLMANQVDVVVHLAGIAHDLSNQYVPEDYYRVNYEGTKKLVDEVLASQVSKFIFVSSIKAAFDTSATPADESMSPNPVTDYGKSKLKAEEYIQSKNWGDKSFYIFRPTMMHGSGNKGNLNLLYRFAKAGIPFPFGAYHNQRSFHSIDNFCHVLKSVIETNVASGVYHLADDGFLSTVQLFELISSTIGKKSRVWKLPVQLINALSSMVGKKQMVSKLTEDMMVSNKKIVTALERPLPMRLEEGLKKTIRSFDAK